MKKILEIAWKDNRLRFSSWTELLFFLILPVIFSVFLSGSLGGDATGDERILVYVVDEDQSELSASFRNSLDESGVVRLELQDEATAAAAFAEDEVPAVLTIPAGFATTLLAGQPLNIRFQARPGNLNAQAAEQVVAATAQQTSQALTIAATSVAEAEAIQPFANETARQAYFEASLATARELLADRPERVESTQSSDANVETGTFDMGAFVAAGQLVTWVFIPLLGASGIYAFERTEGTLRRLVTTPTSRFTVLAGTSLGQFVAAIVQMVILIAIGSWLGINWGNNYLALGVMVVVFALAGVAFGTMLATFVRTPEQASGVSVLLGMAMALLGGCWFPLENFPAAAQQVAQALPTTWAMAGFTDIVIRGQGLSAILPEVGVLLGFMALFMVVGISRFRYE
ncbi:MAG: ABC transporter permease [Anaerolineales bacterium]|nr:ABC transporter permease [Anaerolineales bacterium]